MGCCTVYDDAAAKSILQSTLGRQLQQQWTAAFNGERLAGMSQADSASDTVKVSW